MSDQGTSAVTRTAISPSRVPSDHASMTIGNGSPRRRRSALLGLALALAATASVAQAPSSYQTDFTVAPRSPSEKFAFGFNPLAAWPGTMFWSYNPNGAPSAFSNSSIVANAMQQAIATWSASCNVSAVYSGLTSVQAEATTFDSENGSQPDQVNVLAWRATPAGIAGYTVANPGPNTGGLSPIVDADVIIDPAKITLTDALARLILHEFGHTIGIGHSQFDSALMSGPPYSNYNTLSSLTADDIRACRCLYGAPNGVSSGLLCQMPSVVDFGSHDAGTSSQQGFQVSNNGNAPITIGNVSATPAAWQTTGCGAGTTLFPGQNCSMQVTFHPTNAGDQGGSISFDVGEPTPYKIRLVGSATGGVTSPFNANPSSVDFGQVTVSTTATTQRVKLSNPGPSSVTVSSLAFQGPQSDEFIRSGQCKPGLVVPANGFCNTDIGFTPSATGARNAQLVVATNDGRTMAFNLKGTGSAPIPSQEPVIVAPVTVVEFYRAVTDHYFITIAPDEVAALDTGLFPGWARTGLTFKAYATSQPGFSPICRFYLPQPADSHFYSATPAECAAVQQIIPNAILESTAVMYLGVPNPVSGTCAAGTIPVYRVWNHRSDTNHRYTTDINVRNQMIAKGYIPEGSGPDAVIFCSPQ